MNLRNRFQPSLFCLGIFFLLFSACKKNELIIEYMGSEEQLQGKWMVSKVNGVDVATHKMSIEIKTGSEYVMFDGCNWGSGTFSTAKKHSIQFSFPSLTYMYCNIYKTIAPGAYIKSIRKYSITQTSLSLYDDKGKLIITAEKH